MKKADPSRTAHFIAPGWPLNKSLRPSPAQYK